MWTIIVIFLFSPPPVVWWQMLWLRTARDGDINQVVLGGVTNRHSGEELYQHCDANCNRSNDNHNYLLEWSSDTPTPEPQPLTSLIWAISEGISVKMLKCVEVSWYWYRSTLCLLESEIVSIMPVRQLKALYIIQPTYWTELNKVKYNLNLSTLVIKGWSSRV